jgi:hypothetical protein
VNVEYELKNYKMECKTTPSDAARLAAPAFLKLREKLLECTENRDSKASNVSLKKEVRVLVGAETNSAVDNILSLLDQDDAFKTSFNIVRSGPSDKVIFQIY